MKLLHVAAEAFPWVKTGGLADVVGALPAAQRAGGADVRLLLPGYPALLQALHGAQVVARVGPAFGAAHVRLLHGSLQPGGLSAYLIDAPWFWQRGAGPYQDANGADWRDNLQRFALLGWCAAQIAAGGLDDAWAPDVVHAHDWHAGLACAWLHAHPASAVGSVFTVHNLAFGGFFDLADFGLLGLPARYARPEGLEFHQRISFMKAGLQLAHRVTTVSPSYAREVATPEFGCGFEGVVRARGEAVSGLLNGIDPALWNPARDPDLAAPFHADDLGGKAACKRALQQAFALHEDAAAPLACIVSRLTGQKGIDLVIGALAELLAQGWQLAVQGTGEPALEQALREAAAAHPGRVGLRVAYDEAMAHRLIAGGDAILVPSRFEPCGLTQLYALRYGTLPIVRRVGGLADTVTDADDAARHAGRATGFVFEAAEPAALAGALQRAAQLHRDPGAWRALVRTAMAQDHSWAHAARGYDAVYAAARRDAARPG